MSTIARGDRFRDAIVRLLEAAGMKCLAEVRDDFKKVDIVATLDSPVDGLTTILIETKDFEGNVPKGTCIEFAHEYGALINQRRSHRAWIISRGPLSPDGRAFIESHERLKCLTLDELHRSIFNINGYLDQLVLSYSRSRIQEFYVPPRTAAGEDLNQLVKDWLQDDGADPIAIMGGYGVGKTTFASHLAADLAAAALEDQTARAPILIPLGDVFDDQSLEGLIGRVLASTHRVPNYHFQLFEELNSAGRFVIIFDGFDEMKHGMTVSRFERNVRQFMRLDVGRAKILILGRDTAFHSDVEFRSIIHGQRETGAGTMAPSRDRRPLRPVTLRGFTIDEARSFVRGYLPFKAQEAAARRGAVVDEAAVAARLEEVLSGELDDLLDRPVHAQMLCEIAADSRIDLSGISKYRLYDLFVHYLIEREIDKKGRYPGFDIKVRRRFASAVAWWLWDRGMSSTTTFADIPELLCDEAVSGAVHEFDAITLRRELIAGCLVDKGGEAIFFGHRSIQEFLVAEHLISTDLLFNSRSDSLEKVLEATTPVVIEFIIDRLRDLGWPTEVIARWLNRLSNFKAQKIPLSGLDLFTKVILNSPFHVEPQSSAWSYLLHCFVRRGRAEMEISGREHETALAELRSAISGRRDLLLSAVLFWANAIRLDRGNARGLTASLLGSLLAVSTSKLHRALNEAKQTSRTVWIAETVDFPLWLALQCLTVVEGRQQGGAVELDLEALITIVERELGIGFSYELPSADVRTVRRTGYCSISDLCESVREAGGEVIPVRLFLTSGSIREKLRPQIASWPTFLTGPENNDGPGPRRRRR
jgi:hypothetical protein